MTTPNNDEGRRRLTGDQRAAIDEANQILSEIRDAHAGRLDSCETRLTAIQETLDREDVQGALDRVMNVEEHLQSLPIEGDASILDRLGDMEVALQKMTKGGNGSPANNSIRNEAREVFSEEIARNPILGDLVDNDPALAEEYFAALQLYMSSGPGIISSNRERAALAARANAFGEDVMNAPKVLRRAMQNGGISETVMNGLTTDFDPGFGMRVPAPMVQRIVRKAFELSPLLADSGRASTTSQIYPFLRDTGWDPTIRERGEREDVLEDDDNDELFEEDQIDVHEESVTTRLTLVMIEDGIDVLSEYEMRTARGLGKKASWKVHNGDGNKMPLGLLKDPSVPRVMTGTEDTLPFKALLHAQLDLDPEYEAGASYYLSKGASKAAVLATDAVGNFIWSPSQVDGTPSLLHGYAWKRDAYLNNEAGVDDTGVTFASGALPVLFGNVGIACLHVERLGLQVQIDDQTKKGWRKYWSRRRWGWGVVQPAALRLIEVGL